MNVEIHGQLNTAPREVVDRRFVARESLIEVTL